MSSHPDKITHTDTYSAEDRKHPQTPVQLRILVLLLDVLVLSVSATWVLLRSQLSHSPVILTLVVLTLVLTVISRFQALNYYSDTHLFQRRSSALSATILTVLALISLVGLAYIFGWLDGANNQPQFIPTIILSGAAVFLSREGVHQLAHYAAAKGHIARNIVIYGDSEHAKSLINYVMENNEAWNHVVGIYDQRKTRSSIPDDLMLNGKPLLRGDTDDLVKLVKEQQIDEIILALPSTSPKRVLEILGAIEHLSVDIHLSPEMQGFTMPLKLARSCGHPVINLASRPVAGWQRLAKDFLDRVGALLLLILMSPLLLLVALVLRLESKGPVFFQQERFGFNNKTFKIYKFRSMYVDKLDANADKLVVRNDPRVTRVGSILRKTSIDELPQLINVIKGEMSLVGPRPHALNAKAGDELYDRVVSEYALRHRVKPGITGWAQVNGWRGVTDTEEKIQKRVEHDLYYIENWSFLMDLKILLLTPVAVLSGKNSF